MTKELLKFILLIIMFSYLLHMLYFKNRYIEEPYTIRYPAEFKKNLTN
jgi:hypothetical protein